jgi:hypothetical protein
MENYLQSTAASLANFDNDNVEKGVSLKFTHAWMTRGGGVPLQVEKSLLVLYPPGKVEGFRFLRKWEPPPVETIVRKPGAELPDLDELNQQIPTETWGTAIGGGPRTPWERYYLVYLLDVTTACLFNFWNSTVGTRMMVTAIEERTQWARALYGDDVMPLITLTDRAFHTSYGERRAPDFKVLGFRRFVEGGLRIVDQSASALEDVKLPPARDTLRDDIPY